MMDPLDLAVIRGRFQQIVDEMDLVHTKSAVSPVISEMLDRASAIVDVGLREVVAQGETGLPMFVSAMQTAARSVLDAVGPELRPGDVLVMNDPYLGGTHLPDVKMLRPWFHDGRLVFMLVSTGHYVDVGAASVGAFDPGTTEIYQEGIRIPPTWIVRDDLERSDVMGLITANCRLPSTNHADLLAQRNALDVGARRLETLIDAFGIDAVNEAVVELADRSEQHMRRHLESLPDGTYEFSDIVETDIDGGIPLVVHLHMTVAGGTVLLDFSGTSPSCKAPLNLSRYTTESAAFVALKHLFPDVPNNGGAFRPVTFEIPSGCFLAAEIPDAVGGYTEGAIRVVDVIFGALGRALPERSYAASFGTGGVVTISGVAPTGDYFTALFPMCGGYGAAEGEDGLVHGPAYTGTARLTSVEASERDLPIRWEALALRAGSGGAGRWRGGDGSVCRVRALANLTVSFLGSRTRSRPFGLAGGEPGACVVVHGEKGGRAFGGEGTTGLRNVPFEAGDWLEWLSAGGGGWGEPATVESESVR